MLAFDVPLLYETDQQDNYDYIFLAVCSKKTQKKRVLRRKGMTEIIFNNINNSQMSVVDKKKRDPIIIYTDTFKFVTFLIPKLIE